MALTRKLLKSMGLDESVIESIIDAHAETVDALKQQRDDAVAASGSIEAITQERDQLRQQLEQLQTQNGDLAALQKKFDDYVAVVEADKANATKAAAFRAALKSAGVQLDEFAELLLGKVDLAAIEMDGSTITNAEALIAPLRESYGGCFAVTNTPPVPPMTPPTGNPPPEKDPFERGFDG